jgi:uncharacterized phosphosugar-binding protein
MTNQISSYLDLCIQQLFTLRDGSAKSIEAAAEAVATAVQQDKGFFLFGSGHSALVAHEAFWRAGGLAAALPIEDPMGGDAERLPGYASILLAHYDLQPGGVIIVISNSGINPLPIDVALQSKDHGLVVIAITCLAHSEQVHSRHHSGKKLYEVADIVIDTHGIPGDAAIEFPGLPGRVGATSTLLGVAIIEAIIVQATVVLMEHGLVPPILISSNLPEGDAHNRSLVEHYRPRLVHLAVPTVDEMPSTSKPLS